MTSGRVVRSALRRGAVTLTGHMLDHKGRPLVMIQLSDDGVQTVRCAVGRLVLGLPGRRE